MCGQYRRKTENITRCATEWTGPDAAFENFLSTSKTCEFEISFSPGCRKYLAPVKKENNTVPRLYKSLHYHNKNLFVSKTRQCSGARKRNSVRIWPIYNATCFAHKTVLNLLKPTPYFTYHQVWHSKVLAGDYIALTFWRRNFFQILPHPVFKMWISQEPKKIALWNKQHSEEEKNGD